MQMSRETRGLLLMLLGNITRTLELGMLQEAQDYADAFDAVYSRYNTFWGTGIDVRHRVWASVGVMLD